MKRLTHGYLLFQRKVIIPANSNETRVFMDEAEYIDRVLGFFEQESDALSFARWTMQFDVDGAKKLGQTKVREFHVEDDQIKGYVLDNDGCLDELIKAELYPHIQEKTKPVNNRKLITERSMYIVDCEHYA